MKGGGDDRPGDARGAAATERVVVLGASDKPDRYSNRAVRMLLAHGHEVIPVHPVLDAVEGIPVVHGLSDVAGAVDTVTVYVRPEVIGPMVDALVGLRPRRVIFNPGAEAPVVAERLRAAGVRVEDACTLVLLTTGRF